MDDNYIQNIIINQESDTYHCGLCGNTTHLSKVLPSKHIQYCPWCGEPANILSIDKCPWCNEKSAHRIPTTNLIYCELCKDVYKLKEDGSFEDLYWKE